jgi:hypothetical protein
MLPEERGDRHLVDVADRLPRELGSEMPSRGPRWRVDRYRRQADRSERGVPLKRFPQLTGLRSE